MRRTVKNLEERKMKKSLLLGAAAISFAVGTAVAFGQTSPNAQEEKGRQQSQQQGDQQNRPSAQTPQSGQQQGGQAQQGNQQQGQQGGQAQQQNQQRPQGGQAQQQNRQGPQGGQAQQQNQQGQQGGQAQQGNEQGSGGQARQQQGSQPSQPGGQTTQQGAQPSQKLQQQGNQNPPAGQARGSVSLNQQQQTRVAAVISKEKIRPLTKVDFSLSIGTRVPDTVLISTIPDTVVEIVPQYRGYGYFVTNDQIVIVEPNTKEIVTLLPLSSSKASNEGASERTQFTSEQRASIRRHAAERKAVHKRHARAHVRYKIGETISEDEELYEFPETVYTEVPTVRSYRYVPGDEGGVVLVEPRGRKVIEVIE
jgi:uncharacterized protein DUF1236